MNNKPSIQQSLTVFLNYFHEISFKHSDRAAFTYLCFLFLGLAAYMLAYPVHITDTDLWYHLNGGRYFWDSGTVSSSTFFSFIEPEKYRTNYFWAFQALSYKIYEFANYQGLIIFKSSLVLVSAYFISRIIIGNNKISSANIFQLLIIALLIYLISIRGNIIRPHLISYIMIPAFIYILLHRQKLIFTLPILTVVWVNFHGVEWPVGALICGAFFAQFIFNYKQANDRKYLKYSFWLLACLPAMLINPYGYNILFAPFSIDPDTYLFISELRETTIFTGELITNYPSLTKNGVLFVLFAISLYALFILWLKKQLSIAHIILSLGALALLFRGQRFIWEWMFLSTPVFWSACTLMFNENPLKNKHITTTLLISLTLISPFAIWAKDSFTNNNYPYDYTFSPTATTEFIKKSGLSGKYMAPASLAGYIQWELYPKILIHSDMEFPPFNGLDFFESLKSMTTQHGLNRITEKYNPDFYGVYLTVKKFPEFVEKNDTFTLVSFDDYIALYINKKLHPELAKKFEIKNINPFNIYDSIQNDDLSPHIAELKKLIHFDPHSQDILTALASYLIKDEQYQEALKYIQLMKKLYPKNQNSLFLEGQVYENLEQYEDAITAYSDGLKISENQLKNTLHSYLADSYYQLENYRAAYEHYKISFNPYQNQEDIKRYFKFGYAAIVVGDIDKAKRLLTIMLMLETDETEHTEIIDKAKTLLERINNNQFRRSLII